MDQPESWAKRAAVGVGERIALYRDRQKLSAQQLADRCTELGMPSISRVVIAKLEKGRREAVSTAELQVIAKALGVPPVLLLFPVGYEAAVEVFPGVQAPSWDALEWFIGNTGDPTDDTVPPQLGMESPIALWTQHLMSDGVIVSLVRSGGRRAPGGEQPLVSAEGLGVHVRTLRTVRATMLELGMTPPPLSPEAAAILGEEPGDGPR